MKIDELLPMPALAGEPGRREPTGPIVWGAGKVRPRHLDRVAIVYVRRPGPQQVLEHRESAALRHDLQRRAVALGWAEDRVVVIDEDRGRSGQTAEGRPGFQRLLAEVGLDHVGLILGIEMSRLARSCKDWHPSLELCALFQTLLADQDGLDDPGDHDDRLLLGLKGAMSEAGLHLLKGRMMAGRRDKARRGEPFDHAPIGFVRLPGAGMTLDPDERARDVVRLIFDKFDELGTVSGVLRYLVRNRILPGVRPHFGADRGHLQRRRPNRVAPTFLLHHPIYAGAYSHGRRPTDPRREVPGRPATGRELVPMGSWDVLIRDHLPGYISWRRDEANLARLARNSARVAAMGAPREGDSLLAGLVTRGRCGRRMMVAYSGRSNRLRYSCQRAAIEYAGPACQGLAGEGLDALVERQVLIALEPASLELSLGAGDGPRLERERPMGHWLQRLERARYEADRAARQYHAIEPENRLVGRELERRWEKALSQARDVEEQFDRFKSDRHGESTAVEREMIASLSSDLPSPWRATTTSASDRRVVVRHLVERATVAVRGETEWVDVSIQWPGGFVSHHQLRGPARRLERLRDFASPIGRVDELRDAGETSGEIAEILNREGFHPAKRRETYNRAMARQILSRRGRTGPRRLAATETSPLLADEWWLSDLSRELGMPQPTVHGRLRRGWIGSRKSAVAGGRWILWAALSGTLH